MRTVIIVPTYNERENIGPLIRALQEQFCALPHEMHILIVDDNSPDWTAEVVRSLQAEIPYLHLLQGPKQGLGAAYIRGMRYALDRLDAEVVFEMDADFSHAPNDVPRLLREIVDGADFVIGSRYVPGGSIPSQWRRWRKLTSIWGNLTARYIAGLVQVRDCTGGFRAIRGDLLRRMDLARLRVQGYAFQVALLHEAKVYGAIIREIPVQFVDRVAGHSKLGLRDIAEFIINAWWIRFRSSATFLKFAIVGATGVVVNLGCLTFLMSSGMNKFLASPLAVEVAILSNFLLNNVWTFRWRRTQDGWRMKGLKYNLVSILALGVSFSSFVLISLVAPDLAPQWAQALSIAPTTLVNYFLNSTWTFKPRSNLGSDK